MRSQSFTPIKLFFLGLVILGSLLLLQYVFTIDDVAGAPLKAPIKYKNQITPFQKLEAVYSLLEQMRVEHNRVAAIARTDWEKHEGRWQTYKELFTEKQTPILVEYRQLKLAVRRESFPDAVWQNKTDEEREVLYEFLYGDKQTLRVLPTNATSRLLDELKVIPFLTLTGEYVDPLEDWSSDYTETDPDGYLTVEANTITFTNMQRGFTGSVYKDHGANHFGTTGIDHDISSKGTDFDGNNPTIMIYGLANVSDPIDTTDPIIDLRMLDRSGTNMRYRLDIDDGATDENDQSINHDLATQYWVTITRESGGTIAKSYNDSIRTDLRDTMTVSQGSTSFQYMVNAFSRGGSGTEVSNGFIYDLDLNEAAPDPDPITSWVQGKFGSALDLDGTDDIITISNANVIDFDVGLKNAVTFSSWINADSDGENDVGEIIDKGTNTYIRVDNETSGSLDVEAKLNLATTDATLNISSAITTNQWHHIVLTYADDADDEITLYIDGINKGSSTDGVGAPASDSNNLLIGGDSSSNFDGTIDDVRIYSYARTPDEILQDYNNGLSTYFR